MRPRLAITMGDPYSIGPEIAVKVFNMKNVYDVCVPILIGDKVIIDDALNYTSIDLKVNVITTPEQALGEYGTIDLIDLHLLKKEDINHSIVSVVSGEASFQYVKKAIELAMDGSVDGTVTGPINKESVNLAGHHYSGHTEIYADLTHTKNYAMLLMSGDLRVIHVTTHVSMREACDLITKERVLNVIKLANTALSLIGIENGKIGVAGFNAHCSENGLFGDQEAKAIIPAIQQAQSEGINVEGPIAPDTVFVKALAHNYDIVVAMYHDQGHIPLKLVGFKMDEKTKLFSSVSGINCTIGLPIVRTSVDHGTAFGKAGKNRANPDSLYDATILGAKMATEYKKRKGN